MSTTAKSILLRTQADGMIEMILDMPGSSANVVTSEFQQQFSQALDQLESQPPSAGLIITSAKPSIFVAGADLVAIQNTLDWDRESIIAFCRRGQQLFARLARLPVPVVAAIHGVCVGGGLELALACDARVASDDRKTLLGLPEVKLGLIPGWGGTVRLPRLIGLDAAAHWTCSGELMTAAQAHQLGLVDEMASAEGLVAAAVQWINAHPSALERRRQLLGGPIGQRPQDLAELDRRMRQQIDDSPLDPTAPRVVWQHLRDSCDDPADVAAQKESAAMARVYGSETNAGLLNAFFLGEHAKKLARAALKREPSIRSVAIVGIGLMGDQIAELCLPSCKLTLYDTDRARAERTAERLNVQRTDALIRVAADLSELSQCDLVIESILENLAAKQQLFEQLEPILSPTSVLATNTSVISLAELATVLQRPERFCGLHFCYPVRQRPLVELIRGERTNEETLQRVATWAAEHRRVPLAVADRPGFVVNRVLCPMFNEASHLVTSGNQPDDIDRAMRAAGFEFGPLEFVDLIGIDISYAAGLWLFPRLSVPIEPSLLLHAMQRAGLRGKKSRAGYYRYDESEHRLQANPALQPLIEQYTRFSQPLEAQAIVHRLMLVMANQAIETLHDGTVESMADVDLAMVQGGGIPDRTGGVLSWARRRGPQQLLEELRTLEADKQHRGRFVPTPGMIAWAAGDPVSRAIS